MTKVIEFNIEYMGIYRTQVLSQKMLVDSHKKRTGFKIPVLFHYTI